MTVYFIRAADGTGPIKIGWTRGKPETRLSDIQAMSPVTLTLVKAIPGDTPLESAIHRHFAYLWSHGEWFYVDEALLAFINDPDSIPLKLTTRTLLRKRTRNYRVYQPKEIHDWTEIPITLKVQEVADLLGVPSQKVKRAIGAGKLHGFKVARQWRINKADLMRYCKATD